MKMYFLLKMWKFQPAMFWGQSPLPGCQSPPGLWTIFNRESQPKPSFPLLLRGGTTQAMLDDRIAIRMNLLSLSFCSAPLEKHISNRRLTFLYIHVTYAYICMNHRIFFQPKTTFTIIFSIAGLCFVMSKWATDGHFPTKWRANEQQGGG